jgi:BirA family biotin operon repressor/biotin-[acetyl-CoA-carboxylase] ligase
VLQGIATSLRVPKEQLHDLGIGLKWPNDLLIHGKKLGGILIEGGKLASPSPTQKTWMIIGVGLNLEHSTELEQSSQTAIAALTQCNSQQIALEADLVWLNILEALGDYLVAFNKEGFAPFKAEWNSWDAYQNQSVEITEGGKTQLSGIERGVSPEGALLIEELPGSVPKVIYAGDLSLHKRP